MQKGLFDHLLEERYDQSSLNTKDLLRCDYKQWTMGKMEVGISSTKVPIQEWVAKDAELQLVSNCCASVSGCRDYFALGNPENWILFL